MPRAATGLMPLIRLERGGGKPLHVQLAGGLRAAIARGELASGQQLPSSRRLAIELGISRVPVLAAYGQLVAEGFLETRAAAATYVARALPAAELATARPPARRLRLAKRVAALPRYRPAPWMGWGTFGVHQPALDQFPYALWARMLQRHGRRPPAPGEVRMHPLGVEETRTAIAGYLRTARGVRCDPEQILLVSGSQQALDLCARVLCEPGDAVWMEEPGYWLAREAFLSAGCRLLPVPVDENGLRVAGARRHRQRARFAYVTPAHQYPLGATLSAARRFELLRWARAAGAWILEDDYDGEFRYDAQPVAALQSLDADARVIYIGTFSKVLFPTLRCGYLVLPRDLVDAFVAVRRASDLSPPHLIQTVIGEFIREGHFARHIQRMRHLYRERRAALAAQLTAQLPDWRIQGSGSGLHLAFTPPCEVDDIAACTQAAAASLHAWPLSPTYWHAPRRSGLILGFGSTPVEAIPAAVRRLAAVLAAAAR